MKHVYALVTTPNISLMAALWVHACDVCSECSMSFMIPIAYKSYNVHPGISINQLKQSIYAFVKQGRPCDYGR